MNRDKIGTQTCYIHHCTHKGMLMYIACLCPNLVSVHFYAIPILHFKFPKFFLFTCNYRCSEEDNPLGRSTSIALCTCSNEHWGNLHFKDSLHLLQALGEQ